MSVPLIYARSPNSDQYVYALTSAYRAGYRLYDPDYPLFREPDIYEEIRRDPDVTAAIEMRLHSVAGKDWTVLPASKSAEDTAAAAIVAHILKRIEGFAMVRYNLAEGVLRGRSYGYIEGSRRDIKLPDGRMANLWVPNRIRNVDKRRIYLEPKWDRAPGGNADRLRIISKLWSIERGVWEDIQNPELWIRAKWADSEERIGYGRGLIEAIYFYYHAKTIILREGLQGVERWAQGLAVGKIDGLRDASTGKPNEEVQKAFEQVIQNAKARHVITMDKTDEIEVIHPGGEGHQMITELMGMLTAGITRLILGSVRPSGVNVDTGSYAQAETEADTQEALIQFDRTVLDESLTRDLIGLVWKLNAPIFSEMGLGGAEMPQFKTTQEERKNPSNAADLATKLLAAGIPLKRQEVYERTGWTMPGPDDEVIESKPETPGIPGAPGEFPPPPPKEEPVPAGEESEEAA